MNGILLSIVVPVYNVEKYISRCLDSIFTQSIDSDIYEVIVVDDGSPDNSLSIIESYQTRHKNLKIISKKNGGLSSARNVGFSEAIGQYVWFVDSDDWLTDNSVSQALRYIDENEVDIFMMPLTCYYEDNDALSLDCNVASGLYDGREYIKTKGHPVGAIQRFIIRRNYIIEHRLSFMEGILHEDALYGFLLLYSASTVLVLNESLYFYRIRSSGSIMSGVKKKNMEDLIFIHKTLTDYNDNSVEPRDRGWFYQRIFCTLDLFCAFFVKNKSKIDVSSSYAEYRGYIRKSAFQLIRNGQFVKGFLYCISPEYAYRIKNL